MKIKSVIALAVLSTFSFITHANEALMKSKGCMSCHQVNKKVVGPAFKDVAKVYTIEKGAKDRFVGSMKGSKGKWGAIPMPPQPTLTSSDLDVMFAWISKQK